MRTIATPLVNLLWILLFTLATAAYRNADSSSSFWFNEDPQISPFRIQDFVIDKTGLSILGFAFYDDRNTEYLHWVDHILGNSAVFYNWSRIEDDIAHGDFKEGKYIGQQAFIKYMSKRNLLLPADLRQEAHDQHIVKQHSKYLKQTIGFGYCAIEIFAVMPALETRHIPFVGEATLKSLKHNLFWRCYYRAVNYRENLALYWNVEFICPMRTDSSQCSVMNRAKSEIFPSLGIQFNLLMNISSEYNIGDSRSASFYVKHHQVEKKILQSEKEDMRQFSIRPEEKLGVCTVWPYHVESSRDIDAAIIYEFFRHYSNLDIRLFIFDRDMQHLNYLFKSSYVKGYSELEGRRHQGEFDAHMISHNFTTMSLLDPNYRTFDIPYNDHDKELTYSYCRFEAQALYGINRVLVIDYDEFLICRNASGTTGRMDQFKHSNYLQNYLRMHNSSADCITLNKNVLLVDWQNQSASDCIKGQIETTERWLESNSKQRNVRQLGSIFHCFTGLQEYRQNIKELYYHRNCPATGIHNSCSYKFHFCTCHSFSEVKNSCEIAHLTVSETAYGGWNISRPKGQGDGIFSELWNVANSHLLD